MSRRKIVVSLLVLLVYCLSATVAYADSYTFVSIPAGTQGAEPSSSPGPYAVGLEFSVNAPITVTALGVLDDSSGQFPTAVQVAIYNSLGGLVTPILTFNAASHGTPQGGADFMTLQTPITLPAGFVGWIFASGYSGQGQGYEVLANAYWQTATWTFNGGGGLINLIPTYGVVDGTSTLAPTLVTTRTGPFTSGDPQWAAGTFIYSTPEPTSIFLFGSGILGLAGAMRRKFGV
jgi:hypothetical protein